MYILASDLDQVGYKQNRAYLRSDLVRPRSTDNIRPQFMLGLCSTLEARMISELNLCSDCVLPYKVEKSPT